MMSMQGTGFVKGSLSEKSFVEVFAIICTSQVTGVLDVVSGRKVYKFYFRNGLAVYGRIESKPSQDYIIELLHKSGAVSTSALNACRKKQANMIRSRLEILIEEGTVSMMVYSKAISAILGLLAMEAMLLKKGNYTFTAREFKRDESAVRPIGPEKIKMISEALEADKSIYSRLIKNILRPVAVADKSIPVTHGRTLFLNYLMSDKDFFDYIMNFAAFAKDRKCAVKGRLNVSSASEAALVLVIRAAVILLVLGVLYISSLSVGRFEKPEPESSVKMILLKAHLIENLYLFETGNKADEEKLQMNGYLSEKEIKILKSGGDR